MPTSPAAPSSSDRLRGLLSGRRAPSVPVVVAVIAIAGLMSRPVVHATSSPSRQPVHPYVEWCQLEAAPGNAFTYVEPPVHAPQLQDQALDEFGYPVNSLDVTGTVVNVTYVGFDAFPAARAAFQAAVDIWSRAISTPIPISVRAEFKTLGTGILGSAGSQFAWRNFPNAPISNTYYVDALADQLRNADNNPGQFDVMASFNSSFSAWYFGTDGHPPAGKYDFESVVMHELGHGLGMLGSARFDGTNYTLGFSGIPMVYDRFTVTETGAPMLGFPSPSAALGTQLTRGFDASNPHGPGVYWGGPNGVAANGGQTARLYTPYTWSGGSSYAHLDENVFSPGNANSLMTPALSGAEAIHSPGAIVLGMFADMGWTGLVTRVAPSITAQPAGVTIPSGRAATLSVTASGTAPFTFQWYQGVSPSTTSPVTGATSDTFTTPALAASTRYWVRVANAVGTADSASATVTVVPDVTYGRDFTLDGRSDLLFESASGQLYLWSMNGTSFTGGSFLSPSLIDPLWQIVGVNDFTGDGKPDLLLQHQQTGAVLFDKMDGVTKVGEQTLMASSAWRVVATGDFNGDTFADIAWQHGSTGQIFVWMMKPVNGGIGHAGVNGAFLGDYIRMPDQTVATAASATTRVAGAADFNADGKTDLVWQDETSGSVTAWLLDGTVRAATASFTPGQVNPAWRIRAVGDYNGDHRPDLIWQHVATGDLYAWFLQGTSLTGGSYLSPSAVNPIWTIVGPR